MWAKHKKKVITAPNILTKVKNAQAHNVTTKCVNRYINETLNKTKRGRKKCFDGNVEWKENLNVFRLVQIDLKHLDDIPSIKHIWSTHRGPKYQITMVDVASGYKVVAYIPEKSVTYTSKFLHKYLMPILRKLDIDPGEVLVQTDSGAEFYNVHQKNDPTRVPNVFETTLKALRVNHTTIPLRACTYNSDVESFNGVVERQCLGWYDFKSVENMMTKVHTYLENKNNSICGNRTISAVDKIKKETGIPLKCPVPRLIKL